MLKLFRSKHSHALVFLVLAFLFFSFLFYSNAGSNLLSQSGSDGTIDRRSISAVDLKDARMLTALSEYNTVEVQGVARVWLNLLLMEEVRKLNISSTEDEMTESIKKDPQFADENGVYQPAKYFQWLEIQHLDEGEYERVAERRLEEDAAQKALFGNVHVPIQLAQTQFYQRFAPVTTTLYRVNPEGFLKDAKISADDAKKFYTEHPEDSFCREDETREVKWVLFPLPDMSKMTEEEKKDLIMPLGAEAANFLGHLFTAPGSNQPAPDFNALAAQDGLPAHDSGPFTIHSPVPGLAPSPHFNNTAFSLTMTGNTRQRNTSVAEGMVVMQLMKVTPGALKPFAAVQEAITKSLQQKKAAAEQAVVATALASGSLTEEQLVDLSKQGKLEIEKLPKFEPANAPEPFRPILETVASVADGGFSPLLELSDEGGPPQQSTTEFVKVNSREAVTRETHDKFWARFLSYIDRGEFSQAVIRDYLTWRTRAPGCVPPAQLRIGEAEQ